MAGEDTDNLLDEQSAFLGKRSMKSVEYTRELSIGLWNRNIFDSTYRWRQTERFRQKRLRQRAGASNRTVQSADISNPSWQTFLCLEPGERLTMAEIKQRTGGKIGYSDWVRLGLMVQSPPPPRVNGTRARKYWLTEQGVAVRAEVLRRAAAGLPVPGWRVLERLECSVEALQRWTPHRYGAAIKVKSKPATPVNGQGLLAV